MKNHILNSLPALSFALVLFPAAASAQTNSPGHALVFSGTNQSVSIPHSPALDALPLTVLCWYRSTSTNTGGLVNKYSAASSDGYQVFIQNGHVLAWYTNSGGASFSPKVALDAGVHNDGLWHHIGFSVDSSGGRLYVDGALADSEHWSGTPAPTTNTQPLYLGYYPGITTPGVSGYYPGELDELSVWNAALYESQIRTYMNRSLVGTEPNLIAYWRLDEGSGATAADSSGNGHTGTLQGSPVWTNSDAPVGIVAPAGYSNGWSLLPGQYYSSAAACSADGLRVLTVAPFGTAAELSSDGGHTWHAATLPSGSWDRAASSVHGDTLFASQSTASTTVSISTNFGSTWQPITNLVADRWAVTCSADAKHVLAASQGGQIGVSADGGATWLTTTISGPVFHYVNCSGDGTHMVAVPYAYNIYYSTNSGTSWYQSTMTNNNGYYWQGAAGSADGRQLFTGGAVIGTANPLYRSTDYGVTWGAIPGSPLSQWDGFASSADGTRLIACGNYTNIYVSVDSGTTWQVTVLAPNNYAAFPVTSADGTRSFIACFSANAYASLTPPTLSFAQPNGASLFIAWPNPSAGFNLQQSANATLSAWTNTPIRASVVAGQNQVTLPIAGSKFFRLAFP